MVNGCSNFPRREDVVARFVRTSCYADPALAASALALLGAEERQLLAQLRPEPARLDYLAAHALFRSMIAEVSGCDASRIQVRASTRGRAETVRPRSAAVFGFSISHADGIALCAVARGCAVGADVESERQVDRDLRGMAERICSCRELDELRSLPPSLRTERLLRLFTLHEAMAKAVGSRSGAIVRPGGELAQHVASVRLLPSHLATIVVVGAPEGEPVSVRFEEYMPPPALAAA